MLTLRNKSGSKHDDILTHLHMALLLIMIYLSWHQFCADILQAHFLGDNPSNTVLFQVHLASDHSIIQATIAT